MARSKRTIKMQIEYDGTGYSGWQRQPGDVVTVQGEIERVLERIMQEPVSIDGAGRTDSGVHARRQVASFATCSPMPLGRLIYSANSLLPSTIRINAMRQAPESFHARFSATSREYRYFLLEHPSAIDSRFAGCSHGKPDVGAMNRLALMLIGTHDFAAFSKETPDQYGTLCTVTAARWYRSGRFHVFRIEANRFLRSMVRFLVAGMIEVGMGRLEEGAFARMLESGHRPPKLKPADAAGLFLWKVRY
ncbi:MAG TPA: tRNA pseudouridine(38-40) synthase TruA [Chlorobaculum sp.]|uniref:tRNA pseudouridine synthase A n=1 Tax=Chlorobaculum tepidum (strain ATCC 49652 / DSM 12025 / NBRC 103806 / TLS) TaxID=194439 RepID=TRUA_CHLTE|nr:tRNA pseudouridine(38-40) synthase TruA [Chlorobaculum tepidum]Q8KDR7.1 RecName: Full=tRNA pseudouridine synthase A; AltName: Full=tRNA pseudouridine(38-40) synthase; AltName: Full=tRNA pseudouridylate synthase I; AltName: Full=tRNA-uridine isomerase I [Chlorobaculum tepidum TLS]AAM72213.1 tRNA pseudouridine synthase A [Chlorobaculum tepidum TLS]HBU23058.1 tRNA pseudouridine(38-40) synthase TruA [Chlorobaculum sp.]